MHFSDCFTLLFFMLISIMISFGTVASLYSNTNNKNEQRFENSNIERATISEIVQDTTTEVFPINKRLAYTEDKLVGNSVVDETTATLLTESELLLTKNINKASNNKNTRDTSEYTFSIDNTPGYSPDRLIDENLLTGDVIRINNTSKESLTDLKDINSPNVVKTKCSNIIEVRVGTEVFYKLCDVKNKDDAKPQLYDCIILNQPNSFDILKHSKNSAKHYTARTEMNLTEFPSETTEYQLKNNETTTLPSFNSQSINPGHFDSSNNFININDRDHSNSTETKNNITNKKNDTLSVNENTRETILNEEFNINNLQENSTTSSRIDHQNANDMLLTTNQKVLQYKIYSLYIEYPILIENTSIKDGLELNEQNNSINDKKLKIYKMLEKYLNKDINVSENKNLYVNFHNDLITRYEEIFKFIEDNNVEFTNMEDFSTLYIELIFYKNTASEFKQLRKPSKQYLKKVELSLIKAKINILKELIELKLNISDSDLVNKVNDWIPRVLPVLVKTHIISEDIKLDLCKKYKPISLDKKDPNDPTEITQMNIEEHLGKLQYQAIIIGQKIINKENKNKH